MTKWGMLEMAKVVILLENRESKMARTDPHCEQTQVAVLPALSLSKGGTLRCEGGSDPGSCNSVKSYLSLVRHENDVTH
jgi:hypothetical protein